jgi:hypothetical protein
MSEAVPFPGPTFPQQLNLNWLGPIRTIEGLQICDGYCKELLLTAHTPSPTHVF